MSVDKILREHEETKHVVGELDFWHVQKQIRRKWKEVYLYEYIFKIKRVN